MRTIFSLPPGKAFPLFVGTLAQYLGLFFFDDFFPASSLAIERTRCS